jgi:hypothetical protein
MSGNNPMPRSGDNPLSRVLLGIGRLARFRADGIALFGATPQAFLNSLAPLLAFPLVGAVLALMSGALWTGFADLLASVVALLAPAVLSHALARLWRREELWLRYIVAFNWCQSAMTLAALLGGLVAAGVSFGQPDAADTVMAAIVVVLFYWLAVSWFLAWRALRLSIGRAVLFVLMLNLGTGVLMMLPEMVAVALR